MDEPSTGLDPSSRSNLWNVVKRAKQDRAIILTSNLTFVILFLYLPFNMNELCALRTVLTNCMKGTDK